MCRDDRFIIVTLYKNGYMNEKKEFCKKDDTEEHTRFYNSLIEGYYCYDFIIIRYVPREFENEVRQNDKKVVVEDRREEEYKAPPPRFGYVGHKLSSR